MKTFVVAAALAFAASLSAQVHKQDVDIKAPDGISLKGTFFSTAQPGPAMLLLHQCDMDRHAWDGLANDLAKNGFNVLTVDFRGYGQSGGEKGTTGPERAAAMGKWTDDVEAVYAFLTAQKSVDLVRIGAGGASCGVVQATDLAARHHEIHALVLLSGLASDDGKENIADNSSLPVFGAASEGDKGAAQGIMEAVNASGDSNSLLKIYPGKEHGVPMFAANPELEPMIVDWLKAQLPAASAASQ
jgi:dienelactone hydrolase